MKVVSIKTSPGKAKGVEQVESKNEHEVNGQSAFLICVNKASYVCATTMLDPALLYGTVKAAIGMGVKASEQSRGVPMISIGKLVKDYRVVVPVGRTWHYAQTL